MSTRVANHYGSKRGLLRTQWHRFLYYLGVYRRYRDVDWSGIQRLVFVCKGNICRSAFAEAVASSRGLRVASYGIDTIDAAPANNTAIRIASEKGVDLGKHRTRQLSSYECQPGDLLLAMEPWQLKYIEKQYGDCSQVSLLGIWGGNASPHIEDPFNSSLTYFHRCFDLIENSVADLESSLLKNK